jgi:hypothetical protein
MRRTATGAGGSRRYWGLRAMRFSICAIAAYLFGAVAGVAVAVAAPSASGSAKAAATGDPLAIYAQFDQGTYAPSAPPPAPSLQTPVPLSPSSPRRFAPATQRSLTAGPAQVYLLRGFMNMFSLGMDDLAAMIRARGMSATVLNHSEADGPLRDIAARFAAGDRSPVIIIGHSLGADAVITMAQALDRNGIPVALAVLFDGTAAHAVPPNVARAINFTRYFTLSPGPGFTGTIENVDLRSDPSIDHLNIDKAPALQARVMDEIQRAAASPKRPARTVHQPR